MLLFNHHLSLVLSQSLYFFLYYKCDILLVVKNLISNDRGFLSKKKSNDKVEHLSQLFDF